MVRWSHVVIGAVVVFTGSNSAAAAGSPLALVSNGLLVLGGVAFVFAGLDVSGDVAGRRVAFSELVGLASLLVAVSMALSAWEVLAAASPDLLYGAALAVGAVVLAAFGVSGLRGRFELS